METETAIYFYGHKDAYGWMSNFYPCSFVDPDGIKYNSSEQYFMYKKAQTFDILNENLINNIMSETNPTRIKVYGRCVHNYDDYVWKSIRYAVMKDALLLKFSQNAELKENLLKTGTKKLYEASPFDRIWGIGHKSIDAPYINIRKYGQNLLGKVLMEIRDEMATDTATDTATAN